MDCWPLLPRITAPTLIVRGEHSPVLPAHMARRMLETLDAPEALGTALDIFLRRVL